MTRTYTAQQITEMVAHIAGCAHCSGPADNKDMEIINSCTDESEPPDELEDYIRGSHDPVLAVVYHPELEPQALPLPAFMLQ